MKALLIPFLLFAVVISAMSTTYAKHQSRTLFKQLQNLEQVRDEMNVEWGQLQLEQSTYTMHGKVENAARDRLRMKLPDQQKIVILRR